ncbi:MAG: phage tail tape measure protein, partial [Proteobacteria bacterium]|nr:phage tail tape measure protein [Pseudomonadota bacterium]
FESVKKGAPVAVKAGQSIETFAAVAGTLASVGIKGSEAGTATKNIALALAGVGNQAGKTFKKLKIPLAAGGKMRDVADVFEDLQAAIKDMDEDKMLGVVNAIFGKISLASAANLLGEGTDKIRKLRTTLESAQGSTKATAAFIRNDVKGSIDQLTSAIDGVKISIFSMNEGPLKEAIDKMTAWVSANEKLIATNIGEFFLNLITNLETIVKWIKRIAIGVASFIAFATAVKTATLAVTAFNLIMLVNPIALWVTAITALVAGVVFLIDKFKLLEKATAFLSDIPVLSDIGKFLGSAAADLFGDTAQPTGATGPQIVSPQDRVARSIEEQRTTSTAEVTIKDDTGRAEVTGGTLGTGLQLQQSGGL